MITSAGGLTVFATRAELATILCVSNSLDRIMMHGYADADFHYMVSGVPRDCADPRQHQADD